MSLRVPYEERLAKVEKMAEMLRSEQVDVVKNAYDDACAVNDEDGAAMYARIIRNKMLSDSDKEMVLDRMDLQVPEGATFTAWLNFLKTLGAAVSSDWSKYRQSLRDLTDQEGFPFEIQWPDKPDAEVDAVPVED